LLFGRVRMSHRSQSLYGQIKHKTDLDINIAARYGLILSLKDPSLPNPQEYDEGGMEIRPDTLFGEFDKIFHTLFLYRLHKDGLNPTAPAYPENPKSPTIVQEMMRAHLCRGASSLFPRISNLSSFHHVIRIEQKIDSDKRKEV
jgi:DNA sulfur modification protein DndE